ncbi:MAG: ABC transporter permease subunit [Oscillatoriophycideae cyanobacterium NC_groundwater_1537_Pr4_S-0.65um_50_18]|nr:ABC transporter permease subunit [Oscillatoriophycideae cyanobacterium NC_groundwater_1537_Pr4_S-0.65um_50_18]
MTPSSSGEKIPFWRDDRYVRIAVQAIVVLILIVIFGFFSGNMSRNLQQQGRQFNFSFLLQGAGFNIGETIIPYETNSPYYWAFVVSLVNTLRLIFVGFIATTVIGVVAGIASFSNNWLLRKLNLIYVEVVRNTPLLLQLYVWYFAIFFGFSDKGNIAQLPGSVLVSKKGIVIPWSNGSPIAWVSVAMLLIGAIAAFFIWRRRIKLMEEQGASGQREFIALVSLGVVGLLLFLFGLGWEFPKIAASGNVEGGLRMSLEYGSMLAGLAFYTGAFIAEIVRAGIQSVSKGQWEAAKALGLQPASSMRLVVFPQAMRVIIPSLSSQYMNLAKNSSLALAIGYPDIFATSQTSLNQTGRAVEVILLIMAVYLTISLVISVIMNLLNQTVQFRER